MFKIGLIGAPGSNKAMLGHALWQKYLPEIDVQSVLVENTGNHIDVFWDQAVGRFGTWREDLWVFFKTLEDELEAGNRAAGFHGETATVCVGTILGPLAHAAAGLETLQSLKVIPDDTAREILKRQQALTTLSMLFFENWDYNLTYFALCSGDHAEGMSELEWTYNLRVNRFLQELLESMGVWHRIVKLDGSTVQQAEKVIADIKSYLAKMNGPDDSDEPNPADVHG